MRKIVVLNNKKNPSGDISITACFRLSVPINNIKPLAITTTSILTDATAGENTEVQSGAVIEIIQETTVAPGANLVARAQTILQNIYNDLSTQLINQGAGSKFIGASWDGSVWS